MSFLTASGAAGSLAGSRNCKGRERSMLCIPIVVLSIYSPPPLRSGQVKSGQARSSRALTLDSSDDLLQRFGQTERVHPAVDLLNKPFHLAQDRPWLHLGRACLVAYAHRNVVAGNGCCKDCARRHRVEVIAFWIWFDSMFDNRIGM